MPILTMRDKNGDLTSYDIVKSITVIGSSNNDDINLKAPNVLRQHAQVVFDGRDFGVAKLNGAVTLNGKSKKKFKLKHNDRIGIGDVELSFSLLGNNLNSKKKTVMKHDFGLLKKLQDFSSKLLKTTNTDNVFDEIMDSIIDLTGAVKGFLIILEDGKSVIHAARNVYKENLSSTVSQMSDTIINLVMKNKKAIIISDAMNDPGFSNSESIINLKLNSVMCVPILDRGHLLGIIYVGNDTVKGLFENHLLKTLEIFAMQASLLIQNALLLDNLKVKNTLLTNELTRLKFGEIVGADPSMLEVFERVEKIATTDVSVLICGETGTGKELVAHEIHQRGVRNNGPFITVNCAAVPETLMESEFFGHVKGAFTGAYNDRKGKFNQADGGTIFLDEIGDMPISLQVKLLRVLQEHTVQRIGSTTTEHVDLRVITATNKNLEDEVEKGNFREDLYYRINVVNIKLPPLRDRGKDVILIARFLLKKYRQQFQSLVNNFDPDVCSDMLNYDWPGNVRELENKLKKAVIMCESSSIGQDEMGFGNVNEEVISLTKAREDFQKKYILNALKKFKGNRTRTAKALDVDPRTIFRYLKKT